MNQQPTEIRTWRRFALPASVLLNLFLIALIGGHLLRHPADDVGSGGISLPRVLANAQASLSPSDAAAFGSVMRRDAPRYLESARKLADARAQLERQITAQQFDEPAVKQAFAVWQASADRLFNDIGHTLVEALGQVSPEGRQKLVANRRKARQGFRTP
jgi:Heavy-metal resistance